tara:strand:+ start:111 stop:425 length:315 start_codon:yes stop_codon:yes gene_type:complete
MPVKSPSTAPTKKATTPRKRRAKKVTPVVKKTTVTSFKGGKVVSKVTTLKRPSTARLITADRYLKDISTRWAIHNYEIQELLKDFSKVLNAVKPHYTHLTNLVK